MILSLQLRSNYLFIYFTARFFYYYSKNVHKNHQTVFNSGKNTDICVNLISEMTHGTISSGKRTKTCFRKSLLPNIELIRFCF